MSFWDERYRSGGNSGQGSVGKYRRWKWKQIKKYVGMPDDVIDVGCGDLSFWAYKKTPFNYTGIDASTFIIIENIEKWPKANFIACDACFDENLHAHTVMCMDVLFHIMDDETYESIIDNLIKYSKRDIIIYTWAENPFHPKTDDGVYQKYRNPKPMIEKITNAGFDLICSELVPYDSYGVLYIFRRK